MTDKEKLAKCLEALRKIAELDRPLEATSQSDWRRRAKLIAGNVIKTLEMKS